MDALSNAANTMSNAMSTTVMDKTIKHWLTVIQTQLQVWMTSWIEAHPIAGWFTTHPLITVGLVLVSLILFKGLFDAIAQLIARLWLALLNAPVRLLRFIGRSVQARLRRVTASANGSPTLTPEQQLAHLLERLDCLRVEQDQVLQEVRSLLSGTPIQLQPQPASTVPPAEAPSQLAYGGD